MKTQTDSVYSKDWLNDDLDSLSDETLFYFEQIIKNQKDIEPEFQKVINEHFWELL